MHLPNVTLCCIDTKYPELGFHSILRSCTELSFASVLFFTNESFVIPQNFIKNLTVIRNEKIDNIESYSYFILKQLARYIKTTHVLTIQWDGFIINSGAWQNKFLDYDYIGAPWREKGGALLIGNGGVFTQIKKTINSTF